MEPYSVVITSCNRFDLLKTTLSSLLSHLDGPVSQIIIIEDSGNHNILDITSGYGNDIRVIINEHQIGQISSIDKAYSRIEENYIFHCEDDWEFFRCGFISESFKILNHFPKVSMVGLRARQELNPLVRATPSQKIDEVSFFLMNPRLHPEHFSYSFNPGLRRMVDYRQLGPFLPIGQEDDISYAFKKAGFQIANLENPAVRHIGFGRHVDDPTQPLRARKFLGRMKRSIQKRWKRLKRRIQEG
jgi:hypothetical protein